MSIESELETRLGWILTLGVRASSVLLAAGLVLSFTARSTLSGRLMAAGLITLLATPVARVAASVVEYVVHRDWLFAALTAIVFLELCAGIVAALVFHQRL